MKTNADEFVYVGNYLLSGHAKDRMMERLITLEEVKEVLYSPKATIRGSSLSQTCHEYSLGKITVVVDAVDRGIVSVYYNTPEAETKKIIESKRALLLDSLKRKAPKPLTQRIEIPRGLLEPSEVTEVVKPQAEPSRPAESPSGAPLTFAGGVEAYALYWAKRYKELGLSK